MTPQDLYNDPTKIAWYDPIIIDFETYYDKDYSVRKVTTEKYIRCEQFECIGVAVKHGANPTEFFPRETGIDYVRTLITANPASPVVAHNTNFDLGILAFRYGIHPNFTVDTSIMAKLCGLDRVAGGVSLAKITSFLAERGILPTVKGTEVHNMAGVHADDMTYEQWQAYGDYCKLDVDLAYGSYMHMLDKVPTSELIMADITTKMWTQPAVDLDTELLEAYAARLESDKAEMLDRIRQDLGFADNNALLAALRSSSKFCAVLRSLGVETPTKWSEKQSKFIPAVSKTDLEFLELLEHENPLVRLLVETKLGAMSSMEQTRTATFLDIASRGEMPIPLRYAAAHTGRYGGCFVAGTKIWVRKAITSLSVFVGEHDYIPSLVNIKEVGKNDLVWNGDTFCSHDGVVCNGVQPVISYCGLVGTYGHQVFVEGRDDTVSLGYAKEHNLQLVYAHTPHYDRYNSSWEYQFNPSYKSDEPIDEAIRRLMDSEIIYPDAVCVPVYDIVNVGDTHRYVANGYLVHNSDRLNLQNLSKRTKEPVLRRSIRPKAGHVWVAADSSQIEARVLSMVAGQQDLVDTFVSGRDVYIEMATKIYGKTYDEIYEVSKRNPTKEGKAMRNLGKSCILGMGYSMSAQKFSDTNKQQGTDIPLHQAQNLVSVYRSSYAMIPAFWRKCNDVLDVMYSGGKMWFGGADNNLFFADGTSEFFGVRIPSIQLPNGQYIFYQNLRKEVKDTGQISYAYDQFKHGKWLPKYVFGGSLTENLVQGLAFVILKWQAIEIAKHGVTVNLNVHDEWASVVPREQAARVAKIYYDCMKATPPYIPDGLLDCEVDVGINYADLHTIDVAKALGG